MKCDYCIHNIQRVNGKSDCACKLDPRVPWVMNEKTKCCLYKKAEQIRYIPCRCFRCGKPLVEGAWNSITIGPSPAESTEAPSRTLSKFFCHQCMKSFYKWTREGKKESAKKTKGAKE